MGQIVYRVDDKAMVEAFSLSDLEWENICSSPKGTLLMPQTDWPAVPKTSIRGLRFFAHHTGYPHKLPAPKSYVHTRLQIDIVKTARQLGFKAELEVYGADPSGSKWIADVLLENVEGKKIAFEVQLSSQHLDDFIERSARYKRSDIDVCWFISEKPVASRLSKALCYKNTSYYKRTGYFMADDSEIITFSLDIPDKNTYPENLPLIRFGRGPNMKRLSLTESIYGMMHSFPRWELPYWKWVNS